MHLCIIFTSKFRTQRFPMFPNAWLYRMLYYRLKQRNTTTYSIFLYGREKYAYQVVLLKGGNKKVSLSLIIRRTFKITHTDVNMCVCEGEVIWFVLPHFIHHMMIGENDWVAVCVANEQRFSLKVKDIYNSSLENWECIQNSHVLRQSFAKGSVHEISWHGISWYTYLAQVDRGIVSRIDVVFYIPVHEVFMEP